MKDLFLFILGVVAFFTSIAILPTFFGAVLNYSQQNVSVANTLLLISVSSFLFSFFVIKAHYKKLEETVFQ